MKTPKITFEKFVERSTKYGDHEFVRATYYGSVVLVSPWMQDEDGALRALAREFERKWTALRDLVRPAPQPRRDFFCEETVVVPADDGSLRTAILFRSVEAVVVYGLQLFSGSTTISVTEVTQGSHAHPHETRSTTISAEDDPSNPNNTILVHPNNTILVRFDAGVEVWPSTALIVWLRNSANLPVTVVGRVDEATTRRLVSRAAFLADPVSVVRRAAREGNVEIQGVLAGERVRAVVGAPAAPVFDDCCDDDEEE